MSSDLFNPSHSVESLRLILKDPSRKEALQRGCWQHRSAFCSPVETSEPGAWGESEMLRSRWLFGEIGEVIGGLSSRCLFV